MQFVLQLLRECNDNIQENFNYFDPSIYGASYLR